MFRFFLIAAGAWLAAFCAGARGEGAPLYTARFFSVPYMDGGIQRAHPFVRFEKSTAGQPKETVDISWLPIDKNAATAPIKGVNLTVEETKQRAASAGLSTQDHGVFKATEEFFTRAKQRRDELKKGAFSFRRPDMPATATQIDAMSAIRGVSKDQKTAYRSGYTWAPGLIDVFQRTKDLQPLSAQPAPQVPQAQPLPKPLPQPQPYVAPRPLPQTQPPPMQPYVQPPGQPYVQPLPQPYVRPYAPGFHGGFGGYAYGYRRPYAPLRGRICAPACRTFCRRWCVRRAPFRRRC